MRRPQPARNNIQHIDWDRFDLFAQCLMDSKWTFAKTMQWCPHSYTLRKDWKHEAVAPFEDVVKFIRDHCYEEKFYSKTMQRLNVNHEKYWSMGAPLEDTILINKALIERPPQAYDRIAGVYDQLHEGSEALAENAAVMHRLNYAGESVLDIGSGTGLFLDYHNATEYLGVDPSEGMNAALKDKHPYAEVVQARFEEFASPRKFDLVIGLFGAASYIEPKALPRVKSFLSERGRYFLMFYKPDYSPVTYSRAGVYADHFLSDLTMIGGEMSELGNFIIIEGAA